MLAGYRMPGKASFLLGGQWGSEGKGAAAATVAHQLWQRQEQFDVYTTNAGAQAGHTSTHDGVTRVAFHLPTAALVARQAGAEPTMVYLNAGSIIDVGVLQAELASCNLDLDRFFIHPNAVVITEACRAAEMREDSAQTKIASTRKGVGQALASKVLRHGTLAKDMLALRRYVKRVDLNDLMRKEMSVLVEVPQGLSLSIDSQFYPYCTSRNCTVMQAMSDAGIHPEFYHTSMLVLRTFPIRVGNIVEAGRELGQSGGCYGDQQETTWEKLGVTPEITTVTKRVRRVFTFSVIQMSQALQQTRPSVIYLTFCDYLQTSDLYDITQDIERSARLIGLPLPEILTQFGPTTTDIKVYNG